MAARAIKPCQCDSCGRRGSGMTKAAFTAFNRFGVPVLYYCPACVEEMRLIPLFGVNARYIKNPKTYALTTLKPSQPEPKAIKQLDQQTQMRRLEELGHGLPWKRQRRLA